VRKLLVARGLFGFGLSDGEGERILSRVEFTDFVRPVWTRFAKIERL
jgi:hypothetical protein